MSEKPVAPESLPDEGEELFKLLNAPEVIDYNEKTGKLYLLSTFARMYIGIIRGTPALLQRCC